MTIDAAGAAPGYGHATAFVVGEVGVLVRGPSGAGKSRLTLLVIAEARRRGLFARLVGDDRIALAARHGRLVARGHPAIAGQIERRGEGIAAVPFEPAAVIRAVVDLEAEAGPRCPEAGERQVAIGGVTLPRLVVRAGLHATESAEVLDRLLAATRP